MSVFSSKVLRDMYGTEEMRRIFSDESRIRNFVAIEVALAKVESELGVIPDEAYREIARRAPGFVVDWDRLKTDTETIGYPVMPLLKQLTECCGEAGEYLHWGSTTRDITDTSFVLQVREALGIIETETRAIKSKLVELTRRHRNTVTVARTHGMHALPTTFGFRTAIWLSETGRQLKRLEAVRQSFSCGQFGGAVGTLAAVGPKGIEVQRKLMATLGLTAPDISWFSSRDRVSEVVFVLAGIGCTMASIAKTLVVMTRDEVGEAREPDVVGRGTSSAMPHKHNTVGSELVLVYGKFLAQYVSLVMESMVQDYDRDWQGHFETIIVPQAFLMSHASLRQMNFILGGLQVFPERMRANAEITNGMIMAESVMMALAPHLGRKRAHKLVSAACEAALARQCHLRDVLITDAEVTKHLAPADIEHALVPANYTGAATAVVDQVLASEDR